MARKRILLIDDEEAFTRVLKTYLDQAGAYETAVQHSGRAGLLAAEVFRPDLILLDVIMPDMDGAAVAERLAQNPRTKHIPVIFLTAIVSREETMARAMPMAGHTFMAKPISGKEVVACLRQQLADHDGAS